MFSDLHAHYPLRVLTGVDPSTTSKLMGSSEQPTLGDRIRALVIRFANKVGNFPTWDGTYRIDVEKLRRGKVTLAMSVLLRPFDEMDLTVPYASPPGTDDFGNLMKDLETVAAEVATHDPAEIRVVTNRAELDAAVAAGATALVHAVEGGCHVGNGDEEIAAHCAELARRGVAYVTVAHLFYRQVATNANAVPFIPDRLYDLVFPQPHGDHLTPRGEALVRGLVENRILIDLSHMSPEAIAETLDLMDEIDPGREMPVISTHAGYRFGKQRYMHDEETLKRIAARRGVAGLIMAQHQLNDGNESLLPKGKKETETLEQSLPILFRHIDTMAAATGDDDGPSYDHIGIGSDLDGFIKPTIGGVEDAADLARLEAPLRERYGDADAEKIMGGNALRVLREIWT
ncbi:MAG TPA: membrane dipeptidase [Solirubrobacterales bacterium]|nr:membrane dipeptidase [Solirubrobacterales bacterium]